MGSMLNIVMPWWTNSLRWDFVPSTGRFMAVEVPVSNEGDKTRQFNEQLVAESHDLFLGCFTWEDRFPFYFNK